MGIGKADGRGWLFIRKERMNLHEIAQMLSQLYQRQLLAQNPGTSPRTLAMPVAAVHHTIVTAPKPPRWIANG